MLGGLLRRGGLACSPSSTAAAPTLTLAARALSDFSYVTPGVLAPRRHNLRWKEAERHEVWKSDTVPRVSDAIPESKQGRAVEHYTTALGEVMQDLQEAYLAGGPELYLVHALKTALAPGQQAAIDAKDWAALTAAPTEGELSAAGSPDSRRQAIAKLSQEAEQLLAELGRREEAAVDSGEADLAGLPLSQERREALQTAKHKDLLLKVLQLSRQMSILTAGVDKALSPALRVGLKRALEDVARGLHMVRAPHPDAHYRLGPLSSPLSAPLSASERQDMDYSSTWLEEKEAVLLNRDRVEHLPRKRLPRGLEVDAPNAHLADAARLLDENTSLSQEDKEYLLQHYTDALAGKTKEAFDWSAEKKAWVDSQPQWGVYDPAMVKAQDDAVDALRRTGQFSPSKGYAILQERISPASLGHADLNPSRKPQSVSTEVAAAMGAYDRQLEKQLAELNSSVTAALAKSLGMPAPKAAAAAAAAGAGSSSGAPSSYFKRYLAGERLPEPEAPVESVKPAALVAAAAEKAKAAEKGKAKKKK